MTNIRRAVTSINLAVGQVIAISCQTARDQGPTTETASIESRTYSVMAVYKTTPVRLTARPTTYTRNSRQYLKNVAK